MSIFIYFNLFILNKKQIVDLLQTSNCGGWSISIINTSMTVDSNMGEIVLISLYDYRYHYFKWSPNEKYLK